MQKWQTQQERQSVGKNLGQFIQGQKEARDSWENERMMFI